jgi:hypothetical protein
MAVEVAVEAAEAAEVETAEVAEAEAAEAETVSNDGKQVVIAVNRWQQW